MSTVEWITPDQHSAWDAFVAQHPLGLIYHLSSWQTVLENAFKHIRGGVVVLKNEAGVIEAGLPVYNVRSWLLKNRTVSVPFASVCDPLVSTRKEFESIWRAVEDTARKNKSRWIEVRTRSTNRNNVTLQLGAHTKYKHQYLQLDKSPDELYRSFHHSCIRGRVRRAMRSGVVIEERRDQEALRAFHAALVATRRRHALPPMPFAFFRAMDQYLIPDLGTLYLATCGGRPVGGTLVFRFKNQWIAEYSGHADDAPPGTDQLLHWHAIQCARNSGAACFSFGRTSVDNTGLLEYKRRWATVEEDLTDLVWCTGDTVAPENAFRRGLPESLYSLLRLLRYTPAPLQRAFGDFCYRHLG